METIRGKEKRFLSEDAIALMSMLPSGLTEEWQERAFNVFGRTKEELAAPELLEALIELEKELDRPEFGIGTLEFELWKICNNAIKKVTE